MFEHEFLKETGSKKIDVFSRHCVTNYMFRFRRDDAFKRNEWTNYTNWAYDHLPYNVYDPHDDRVVLALDNITPQTNTNELLQSMGVDITTGLSITCDANLCKVTPAYNPPIQCSTDYLTADPSFNDIYKTNYKIEKN